MLQRGFEAEMGSSFCSRRAEATAQYAVAASVDSEVLITAPERPVAISPATNHRDSVAGAAAIILRWENLVRAMWHVRHLQKIWGRLGNSLRDTWSKEFKDHLRKCLT